MNVHYLKIDARYYQAVVDGRKTAEIRINDRDFKVGHYLSLHESKNGELTESDAVLLKITHIVNSDEFRGLAAGFVLLSFEFIEVLVHD